MTPRQQQTLEIVSGQQPVSTISIARQMQTSKATIGRYLWNLQAAGMVAKTGTGGHVRWVLAGDPPAAKPMREYEQAASVWQYADRCRRGSR